MEKNKIEVSLNYDHSLKSWMKQNKDVIITIIQGWFFSRLLLTLVAWFTSFYPVSPIFPEKTQQQFEYSSYWLIDIWCRWDTGWYLNLFEHGYQPIADLSSGFTNLAFFPLYPSLVRLIGSVVPGLLSHQSAALLIGLVISNISFILAMIGLYALCSHHFGSEAAKRSVIFAFCLPGAFFYSAFYTESLFLCLAVFACLCAEKGKWVGAGIFGMLAAFTRSHGFLIVLPLAWTYMSQINWEFRKIGWKWTWLVLIPLAVLIHFGNLYRLTGNFFAFLDAQKAWSRSVGGLPNWQGYARPLFGASRWVSWVDLSMVLLTLYFCFELFRKSELKGYAIYGLTAMLLTASSGNLNSSLRFVIVIFPMMMWAGYKFTNLNKYKFTAVCITMAVIQMLMYSGWVKLYWIA